MGRMGGAAAAADTRTSTIVVAASNSLDPTLAPDAYRCSGVADNVEINAALVAAAAVNGRVELLEGAYNTVLALSIAVNVALFGNGFGSVINFNAGGSAITFAGDNAKLRDLKVVIAAGAGAGGSRPNCISASNRANLEVLGVWLVGDETVADDGSIFRQCGIFFDTVTYSRVALVRAEDNWRSGIQFYLGSSNIVTGSTSISNGDYGISFHQSHQNVGSGNVCNNNTVYGFFVDGGNYNTVTGNTCTDNAQHGIRLCGTPNPSHGNALTGNTCYSNTKNGLMLSSATRNLITANTFFDNTEHGIRVDSADLCTIVGNNCYSNNDSGIMMMDCEDNTVLGNNCYDNHENGILVTGGGSESNAVSGNTCNGNDDDGINIQDQADYTLVMCNTCDDNTRWGISIGVDWAGGTGNWVKNNSLRGNGAGPFSNAGGIDTKLAVKIFQFTEPVGTAAWQVTSPAGIVIDAANEGALALGEAQLEVQMVVQFRVKGVALGATGAGKGMLLEININAGKPTGSEAYNAEAIAVASAISTEDNVAVNDAIEWIIDATDDVDVDDIGSGETIEMFAMFEDTGANGDIATNAAIRTISMEYV